MKKRIPMLILLMTAPIALAQCPPCEYNSCAEAGQAHDEHCARQGLKNALHLCVEFEGMCPHVLRADCTIDGHQPEAHIDLGPF